MPTRNDVCVHEVVDCLNQYELIRKYRCTVCAAVMMCKCDENKGRRFLPHQRNEGRELSSQRRGPGTHGSQSAVCEERRGLKPANFPMAAIHGRSTKIRRYYWRELFFRERALWESGEVSNSEAAEQRALQEIQRLHERSPKYDMEEESDADFLARTGVRIENLRARVLKGGLIQLSSGETVS